LAGVVAAGALVIGQASAATLESRLDQFVVMRNGTVWLNDTFSDGVPPPSGEGTFGTSATPVTYFTQGGFVESAGKLVMNSELTGLPVFISLVNANTGATILSNTELTRVHTVRALSNTSQDPNNSGGLKRDFHTFEVMALYDLVSPPARTNNYGISLIDNFTASGPTRDRMRLSVTRSTASDQLRVAFWRNDQTTDPDQNLNFGSHALQTNHDQIVLRLSRNSTASNEIVASYAYVDGANVGMDISNPTNLAMLNFSTIASAIAEPTTIFNQFIHTRAEFRQLAPDEDNRFDFVRLTTGSPVSIGQVIYTGTTESLISFNYRFETVTGELTVALGDTELGSILAPGAVSNDFATASFLVGAGLLDRNLTLRLILDGPTGSRVLLDSINFAGLQNSNFASGDLTGWDVVTTGTGSVGVLTITAVPEPETYALLLLGLGLVLVASRRRRRYFAMT
jgi:hypothetical protein